MTVKNRLSFIYYEIVSALIISFSVVPGFRKIGNLFLQVFLTFAIVFIFLSVSDIKKIKPSTVSHSLIIMCLYWITVALIKQIELHISVGNKNFEWLFIFYYDKPALLFVVFFSASLFYVILFFNNYNNEEFCNEYKSFQKTSLITFSVYYLLILIYCFIIVRKPGSLNAPVNLIPFNYFSVMKAGNYEYEFIFLLFGNIAIFLPLGIIFAVLLKRKHKLILASAPFIISIGVEVSQYFIGNGWADIDDVIFNVVGFYIGVGIKILLDFIIKKLSKGKIDSIFVI